MIGRLVMSACLAALPLAAQLSFSVVQSAGEVPAGSQVQLPAAAAGDTLQTLFRVRNTGNAAAALSVLSIAGAGFSLANLPALPATLPPGAYADFTVRFQPAGAGSYSALLKTDGLSVFVLANAVAVLSVYLDQDGYRKPLDPAAPIDFGSVERGGRSTRRLVVVNQTAQPLAAALGVSGGAFQIPAAAVALDVQNSTALDVIFAPTESGPQQGEFRIDQRRFILRGGTLEPPLPAPIVSIDLKDRQPSSALQPVASVRFDPAPRTSGSGRLRIELKPAMAAPDDPGVLFVSTGSRSIDFSVIEGEPTAQFGPAAAVPFQTGTTAGTIVLTAELGDRVETTSIEIPPQPVAIDAVRMTRTASGIDVQISGYDNTHSLWQASYTFLQMDGTPIAPGAIQQDVAALFKDYFANSGMGGAFQLKASFPVAGNGAMIGGVTVTLTNGLGQTARTGGI